MTKSIAHAFAIAESASVLLVAGLALSGQSGIIVNDVNGQVDAASSFS